MIDLNEVGAFPSLTVSAQFSVTHSLWRLVRLPIQLCHERLLAFGNIALVAVRIDECI